MADERDGLVALARRQRRVGMGLTALMVAVYFGFVLAVAYAKDAMAAPLAPGLSGGIALGAAVIVFAWLLTGLYIRWANTVYDPAIARLRDDRP